MTRRARQLRRYEVSARRARRMLIGVTVAVCLPVAIVISRPTPPDLFDLVPKIDQSGGYVLLAWPDLERARAALSTSGIASGTMIRALGYMMEGDQRVRDGDDVERFILLPDVGTPAHPAHRFGDQMIDVRLAPGGRVRFSEKHLVWVSGKLQSLTGNPSGPRPLYLLENADVEPATQTDIARYFR
jgi:hypothetical protein